MEPMLGKKLKLQPAAPYFEVEALKERVISLGPYLHTIYYISLTNYYHITIVITRCQTYNLNTDKV